MEHACIVSVVTVVGRGCGVPEASHCKSLQELHRASSALHSDFELVVIVNGVSISSIMALKTLASELPNTHFYILQKPVDYLVARLAGLENALGDWIAFVDLGIDPPDMLDVLLKSAFEGHDVIFANNKTRVKERSIGHMLLSPIYHRFFAFFHGFDLQQKAPTFRLFSRAVANAITQDDFPLLALDLLPANGGYRTRTIEYSHDHTTDRGAPLPEKIRERWRTIIGIGGAPLRFANLICAFGAMVNLVYSCYVIFVYLFKPDVVPGWTTLSLQVSGMFFLISLVLWLLSEYLLLMFDHAARRNVYRIADEFSSNVQTRHIRLNVEVDQ